MRKKTFTIRRVIVLLLLLAAICAIVYGAVNRERIGLERFARRCGGSLNGLDWEIIDQFRLNALQDPWMVYAVKISGDTSGTLYDTSEYQDGPLYVNHTNVAASFAREMKAETGDCFFEHAAAPGYPYRISTVQWRGWTLFAVRDPKSDIYYLFFDSFFLQGLI